MTLGSLGVVFFFLLATLAPARGQHCETCSLFAGQAQGALDFGTPGETSLILSPLTSAAIASSSTPLSFTIEAWVNVNELDTGYPQPLFSRYSRRSPIGGDSQAEFVLLTANETLFLFFGGGLSDGTLGLELDCGSVIVPNEWTHVALTVDTPEDQVNPSIVTVFIDGLLSCQWSEATTPFNGQRQVMPDQPLAFSNYQSNTCGESLQTLNGSMDEIRVWSGARSSSDISFYYNLIVPASSENLVAMFHLDRTPAELSGNFALDSSRTAANAFFTGTNGNTPAWIPSKAPIVTVVEAANFELVSVPLYGFAANPNDTWAAMLNATATMDYFELNFFFEIGGVLTPLEDDFYIQAAPGSQFPVVYFNTSLNVSTLLELAYEINSEDPEGMEAYSNLAYINTFITPNGCDGKGGLVDSCGVCNGNGNCSCEAPNQFDICGVCNGNGSTCYCAFTTWRNLSSTFLDETILFGDINELEETMESTRKELNLIVSLLLSDPNQFPCYQLSTTIDQIKQVNSLVQNYTTQANAFLSNLT